MEQLLIIRALEMGCLVARQALIFISDRIVLGKSSHCEQKIGFQEGLP